MLNLGKCGVVNLDESLQKTKGLAVRASLQPDC